MAAGKWQMANGKWQMANGKWQMANGNWQLDRTCTARREPPKLALAFGFVNAKPRCPVFDDPPRATALAV
ncbi:hypothetical protein B0J13DRAFT_554355 [Dactylonectria estremocensis]|uniref:Uncharacterized protein n=1 Tax=Dactylonectria estremocensis TaxID=1079267 RepID=A0A9P9EV68_9HYPO|nr:hypothetical protein B0J13DRAFT_554355 [Dactylonectria estremocensis]